MKTTSTHKKALQSAIVLWYTPLMKNGNLKTNGVHLRDHEYATVKLLLENGYDVELIPPSQINGLRMPDIMLHGTPWEMKSPQGGGKCTIMNTIQNGVNQSRNMIVDLRRCKLSDEQALKELKYYLKNSKRLRRLKVITKAEIILDL